MFKVIVTGAKGQVGSELLKAAPAGFAVIGLGLDELDITDLKQVRAAMAKYEPSLIINAAAYTAVDKTESDVEATFAVNETATHSLAEAALALNIPLFHISTDYVFDSVSSVPCKETDPANPQSVYGASKLAGEQALQRTRLKYIILRTSWVFGTTGNNIVKTLLRVAKERSELSVIADQYGCPPSARSIADVLWELAEKYAQEKSLPWGIYHFSNSPACTWHEFACEIFEQTVKAGILEKAPLVNTVAMVDYPTAAKRPTWSTLSCGKIEKLTANKAALWKVDLECVLDSFAGVYKEINSLDYCAKLELCDAHYCHTFL